MIARLQQPLCAFSWPNARALLGFAERAYAETSIYDPVTDTQLIFWTVGDCTVLAFRGSTSKEDWRTDFNARLEQPDRSSPQRVHAGFQRAVWAVLPDIEARLSRCTPPAGHALPAVICVGHSLGGALAQLAAYWLQTRRRASVHAVYTFGGPRIGNASFRSAYNRVLYEETYRVVNENDIVPRVPGWLMGYRHVGQEIFLPMGGGHALNPSLWFKLCSDAVGFWYAWRHRQDQLVADHTITAYLQRMQLL